MTRRIFNSILSVAAAVMAASLLITLAFVYSYFTGLIKTQLQTQTALVSQAVENEGAAYFDNLDTGSYRISWISADGTVLYDSDSDAAAMENHADRQEVIQALQYGSGESQRYSQTLTEQMYYYASRLTDGTVIRLASSQSSLWSLLASMMLPIIMIMAAAILLTALCADRLARHIVKPLNELNLDSPMDNDTYDEVAPLLNRIESQHTQIAAQRAELKRQQDEWDSIAGNMNEGIVLLSNSGLILSLNNSAAALLQTAKTSIGQNFLTVCRRLDIQQLIAGATAGAKGEQVVEFEAGSYQVSANPVSAGGQVKGVTLLLYDVTAKQRAEQMRREFTANVSHELKTPLHTISGTAEIIKNGLVQPADMDRFIDRIYTESVHMINLIDDIIRLSRLDEGATDMPQTPLVLKDIASQVAERLQPQAAAAGVAVSVTGDPGRIDGISQLISEMIYNLTDNAIKYNRPDGNVIISIAAGPQAVALTVSDSGIGIPPADQSRIFERFFRVDKSHSRQIGGTGLGLSIVKHIAQLHKAQLSVVSRVGEGTAITVTFPAAAG